VPIGYFFHLSGLAVLRPLGSLLDTFISGQKGSVHVTVLLDFFDELRRRVPSRGK
jgi:hypothetical protein